jgi:tRNA (cytidine/uridine-2'-O-)-methyltransferase
MPRRARRRAAVQHRDGRDAHLQRGRVRAGDALLFGPETRGLPPAVLALVPRARQLTIPMRPHNRSLNLANAVALVVYEAWRQNGFSGATALRRR